MKYKHIIFDLDGTLIDTEAAVLNSLKETLQETHNGDYKLEDLHFALGIPGVTALQMLKVDDIEKVVSVWQKKFKSHFSKVRLFPYIKELLFAIKDENMKIGVLTSKTRLEYIEDFLPFGLQDKIDISLCIDDYHNPKPSSAGMLLYLKQAGIKADEALYIGDTMYDYQCAREAGVDFGLAVWGCKQFEGINAAYFIMYPEEVVKIIKRA
ncbi:HAD family hydrolase [Niabella sp.]|uniref:HAD family hydrolase n=1 Tax=Niabella sp. TaxID=1962976 RepID=UPI0026340023|nr:HAD family hydrolase [Niabella sp.]